MTSPLEFAASAAAREASRLHVANVRRLESLRIIAISAPLLGILGWLRHVLEAFGGMREEHMSLASVLIGAILEGAVVALVGAIVALIAKLIGDHLRSQSASMDVEMKTAALSLVNELSRLSPAHR